MSTTEDQTDGGSHRTRQGISIGLAIAATAPGLILRFGSIHISDPVDALLYGMAIIGSAFLLSWAAEAAQLDISAGLAIAILAFIAVLPEYAVDLVFAVKGGNAFEQFGVACQSAAEAAAGREPACSLALANMTGANRLLIGVGWSLVVFLAWYKYRQKGIKIKDITLDRSHSVELAYLSVATIYSLTLPLKHSITLIDAAILVSIFIAYTIRISKAPAEEPHLVGPAELIGTFSPAGRRASYIGLFVFAAGVILLCAEHFAESLVETGATLGISEFFLVQWLAPLASEAPELLVAGLYAWRLNTNAGLGTLVSSKVNQWTLLVGTLPIAFAIASSSTHGLPIIARQRDELLLTAAQSFFAICVLLNLKMSLREAWMLFIMFWTQFLFGALVPSTKHGMELIAFSVVYLIGGLYLLTRQTSEARQLFHNGFRASYAELEG